MRRLRRLVEGEAVHDVATADDVMDIGLERGHEKGVDGAVKECAANGDGDAELAVQFQHSERDA